MATPYHNPLVTIDRHKIMAQEQQKVLDERILSQTFNQLSTSAQNQKQKQLNKETTEQPTAAAVSTTKMTSLLKMIGIDLDLVPDYLSKTNPSFEKKVHSILPSTIKIEELRKVAMLMYKIISLELVHSLWIVYRKSGMGELPSTLTIKQIDTKIWPIEVQSNMKLCKFQFEKNDPDPYLTFVNYCLRQFDDQNKEYRQQLNMKISHLMGYTRSLEYIIEKFVQQGLIAKRLEIERDIALVQYHYTDVLLKRIYLTQNPSENQIKIVKRLCKLKYDQEMTKHEANFLKQHIPRYLASHPFEKEPIAKLPLIDDINDPILRQQLYKQYKETAEQGRMKMMNISLECAEEQMNRCQQKFNIEGKQIWDTEKSLPIEQQLTSTMRNLIDQRLANITARIECLYKFKIQLFQIK